MKVLITRPIHLASQLGRFIELNGFTADIFPVIEIASTPYQSALMAGVERLKNAHMIIFVSRAAVHYGMRAINAFWPSCPSGNPNVVWVAIGPGTKQALQHHSIPESKILYPLTTPYESESLLTHPDLQQVQGKCILIFQGNSSRDLLRSTLLSRGAAVTAIECYQRRLPIVDLMAQHKRWQDAVPDVTLTTSIEGLCNLVSLTEPLFWGKLRALPMIVVSLRMKTLATTLGIKQIFLANGADDRSILNALLEIRDMSK